MEERKDICEGYDRDSVQQLDKLAKDKNERFQIYPLTYIQAVYDARTKERLDAILWKCNNVYLPWMGSAGDTRIQLPFWMRRKGIIITYKNLAEETITEKLTYDLCIADDFLRLDSSWTRITDALPVGGNITIGSNGNWFQDGVDTGFKAQGPKGDNGLTPMLRTVNNKLQYSYDGEVWNEISEYIAAWFRYQDNKIQISRDQKTWSDLSSPFTQDLYIKGYVATSSELPSTGVKQGDIYMVGPTYASEDTGHTNPIYRMYVYNDSGWVDNGVFQSIAAGVVQTIGNSETEVMSQKAVSSIVGLDTYPVFFDTKDYVKGDIVNYGGLLYEFTADHARGVWSGTDVKGTSLMCNLSSFYREKYIYNLAEFGGYVFCDNGFQNIKFLSEIYGIRLIDGEWHEDIKIKSILIHVTDNLNKIVIRNRSISFEAAFLKNSYPSPPEFCEGTDMITGIKQYYTGEYDVPTDCTYIYINIYRGGTKLIDSVALYSKDSILNKKTAFVKGNDGFIDLTKYKMYNISGSLPYMYEDISRASMFVPFSNGITLKVTVKKEGYEVFASGYEPVIYTPYDYPSINMNLKNADGSNATENVKYGETKTFIIPEYFNTICFFVKSLDDTAISREIFDDIFTAEFTIKENIYDSIAKTAHFDVANIPYDVIHINTKEKKIYIPNEIVVLYGYYQTKWFGLGTGICELSYDIKGIGNYCKILFNPTIPDDNKKFYIVDREKILLPDEYFICGIQLNPVRLSISSDLYVVDGSYYRNEAYSSNNSIIYYEGNKLNIPISRKNALSSVKIGTRTLSNDTVFNNVLYYSQGMAFYNDYLFRIGYGKDKKGLCQIFDISNKENITLVNRYYLDFSGDGTHSNCCQFDTLINDGYFPLLYITNGNKSCIVEKVTFEGSEVVQTINVNDTGIFVHETGGFNYIIGDDGFIWAFGEYNGYQFFAKFNKPNLALSIVELTIDDVVDSWEVEVSDGYTDRIWQGGKIRDGRLYFLYGSRTENNRLYVFNTSTHEQEAFIPLSSINEEVEDIDFHNGAMYIGLSSILNGMYEITNIDI